MPSGTSPPGPEAPRGDNERAWRILGLRIARETEFVALSAFALSVAGIVWQVWNYARGPDIRLFPPDLVTIASTGILGNGYAGEPDQVRFIASAVSYTNGGDVGQNGVVRREYLEVGTGAQYLRHTWDKFVVSDMLHNDFVLTKRESANPFPVSAGSALSHETLFAPEELDCTGVTAPCRPAQEFVTWDYFMDAVRSHHEIRVKVIAATFPHGKASATCWLRLRDWEIADLGQYHWLTVACHPDKGG